MANIADVAQEAMVSVATVSRVLNQPATVRDATAQRVLAAIAKLNYEPNQLARNFRRNESRVALIITPNVTNPYYAHILSGISDEVREQGYSALIFNTFGADHLEAEALALLDRHRADGAILLASGLGCEWLTDYASRSAVVQCSEYDPSIDIPHVSIDNYAAATEAMEYLIGLGHQRIATISSTNTYVSTAQRLQAYRDALIQAGLPQPDTYIAYASKDYSFESGRHAARQLLSTEPRPTAVFCISDTLALGAVMAARELGLRVPDDVSVLGFDDVEFTTMLHPHITTMAQPCNELGRQAARLLCDQMLGTDQEARTQFLPHKLVIRQSCAVPPKEGTPAPKPAGDEYHSHTESTRGNSQ